MEIAIGLYAYIHDSCGIIGRIWRVLAQGNESSKLLYPKNKSKHFAIHERHHTLRNKLLYVINYYYY